MKKIIPILLSVVVCSCTSSRITSSWKADTLHPDTYKKILVLGITNDANRDLLNKMEKHLAGDLRTLGYEATPSSEKYAPASFENVSEKAAVAKIEHDGFDAVVTVVLLDKRKEQYYTPNKILLSPFGYYERSLPGYYSAVNDRVIKPGYYGEETKYFWESNFYDLPVHGLEFSAQTQSFDPASTESLAHEYGKMIVKKMAGSGVLQQIK